MDKPLWIWLMFLGVILCLLIFDLGVLHRKEHEIQVKESLWLSLFYIGIATIFGGWIWYYSGVQSAEEYFTGYLIEKSLALDNIFIISLFFKYFQIPRIHQHRVLFWGIIGVLVMRAIMIGLGAVIVETFAWALYLFGAFLIFTGLKMLWDRDKEYNVSKSKLLIFLRKHLPISTDLHGNSFFIRQKSPSGKLKTYITPLFFALIFIEITDFVFAVDSVPAIFAITTDPFIVYTSNIFAILGLRALYFALDAVIHRFKYLKISLSAILIFIGSKIFIADFMGLEKFPASISLAMTFGLLLIGFLYSLIKTKKNSQ